MASANIRAEDNRQNELICLEPELSFTVNDRAEIHEVIALHGHLSDAPTSSSARTVTAPGHGRRASP